MQPPRVNYRSLELNIVYIPLVVVRCHWEASGSLSAILERYLVRGGEFKEVELVNRETAVSDGDDFCYITGNPQGGYYANFSSNLATNMSLSVIYQRYPSGMPSLTSVCELSDPTYVTWKVESYVLYSRGDDRFQVAEARANTVLLNMTGRKMKGTGGQGRVTNAGFTNPLG